MPACAGKHSVTDRSYGHSAAVWRRTRARSAGGAGMKNCRLWPQAYLRRLIASRAVCRRRRGYIVIQPLKSAGEGVHNAHRIDIRNCGDVI